MREALAEGGVVLANVFHGTGNPGWGCDTHCIGYPKALQSNWSTHSQAAEQVLEQSMERCKGGRLHGIVKRWRRSVPAKFACNHARPRGPSARRDDCVCSVMTIPLLLKADNVGMCLRGRALKMGIGLSGNGPLKWERA